MVTLKIAGSQPGFEKVKHTKALQELAGLPLSEAKKATDKVLNGDHVCIPINDMEGALHLAQKLTELGALAEVTEGSANAT